MIRRRLTALLLVLPACAARQPPAPARQLVVEIALEHVANADAWQITYRLSEPVNELRFRHADYPFRLAHWQHPQGGAVRLWRDGSGDRLSARGTAFRQLTLTIPGYSRRPEKAGPLLLYFADGSRLVYTGYLEVQPMDGKPVETTFTFIPRDGERVIVLGTVSERPVRWRSTGDGTDVYFGRTTPVVTRDLTLVVDTGAPRWLVDRTTALLPSLFAMYTARTKRPLDFKPVVFLNYGDEPRPGSRSIGGGTLPGLVQLEVRLGSDFQGSADENVGQDVVLLLAHEAAHFWNGEMFRNRADGPGDWMHEGGADAFAFRAMLDLGAMTREQYLDRLSQALSGCMLGLDEVTLHQSSQAGRTKNPYNCGGIIALLTEAVVRRRQPGLDLFGFWSDLFARSRERRYDESTYLSTLRAHGGEEVARLIEALLGTPGTGARLLPALAALGVRTAADDSAMTRDYKQLAGKVACAAVIARDCGARSMVNQAGDGCAVDPASTCQTLTPGSSLVAFGPHRIGGAGGPAAYDHVVESCADVGAVSVETTSQPVLVPCAVPPPVRPPYTRIESLPF
jgi:hypothetical protein